MWWIVSEKHNWATYTVSLKIRHTHKISSLIFKTNFNKTSLYKLLKIGTGQGNALASQIVYYK